MKPLLLAICLALPWPVAAQSRCLPTEVVREALTTQRLEKPVWRGLTMKGAILEIYESDSGTWTAVLSMPDGMSCPFASGEFGQAIRDRAY